MSAVSYLFVPGMRTDRIGKAFAAGADAVVVDWEDAVADADKAAARRVLGVYFAEGGRPLWLRINRFGSPHFADDLAALAAMPDILGVQTAWAASDVSGCELQRVFQGFTGTEFRSFRSSDGQRLAGFGVTALTLGALAYVESAKTNQSYCLTFFQSGSNSIHHTVQSFACSSFRDIGFLSNCFNQFRLVHNKSLSIVKI